MVRDVERRLLPTALATLLAALTLLLGVAGASTTTLAGRTSGAGAEGGSATTGQATSAGSGRLAVRERTAAATSRIHRGTSAAAAAYGSPRAGSVAAAGSASGVAATSPDGVALFALTALGLAVATPADRPTVDCEGVPPGRGPPPASGI